MQHNSKYQSRVHAVMGAMLLVLMLSVSVYASQSKFSEEELSYMPAVQLIELFKKGETTPSEVLEAQISRVKK